MINFYIPIVIFYPIKSDEIIRRKLTAILGIALIIVGIIFIIFNDRGSVEPATALQAGIIFVVAGIVLLYFCKSKFWE